MIGGRAVAAALAAFALLGACGTSSSGDEGDTDTSTGTLHVFAASSLTEAFAELGTTFEAKHPGLDVTFNFAGSSALVQQLDSGAPASTTRSSSPATGWP
jgi:molybdate transport system substrate-binding protein